MQKRSV